MASVACRATDTGKTFGTPKVVELEQSGAPVVPNRSEVLLYYMYFSPRLGDEDTKYVLAWQKKLTASLGLCGRVLVSSQGVNGNVAGPETATATYMKQVETFVLPEKDHGTTGGRSLFDGIHWKRSQYTSDLPPFPRLRVRQVSEIVSSGGTLPWKDADPKHGGKHLKPREFHKALTSAKEGDNLVVLDVRNRWEYEVGHFTDAAGRKAIHPNMRNFTQFKDFVDTQGPKILAGKKVLMYCTGGIRCETASAYLVKTGIADDVCQLEGGIHTYCEEIANVGAAESSEQCLDNANDPVNCGNGESLFLGSNFVFDRRATLPGGSHKVVGECSECSKPYDRLRGDTVCTVCVCPVLVCPNCTAEGVAETVLAEDNTTQTFQRHEWYCQAHRYLRGTYYHYLNIFGKAELNRQGRLLSHIKAEIAGASNSVHKHGQTKKQRERERLRKEHMSEESKNNGGFIKSESELLTGSKHPNWRDTKVLSRHIQRVKARIRAIDTEGMGIVNTISSAPPCRCCGSELCDGRCWGFWKSPA